jgi:hypothetical protein
MVPDQDAGQADRAPEASQGRQPVVTRVHKLPGPGLPRGQCRAYCTARTSSSQS